MSIIKSFLVVSFCVLAAFASEPKESVVTLTTANFDEFIKDNSVALVEFYAPWCGHCKRLAPEFEKAAKTLEDTKSAIKLGKVDATAEEELARKFGVNAYPSLKLFRDGKPEEYKGGRTADTIVSYLEKVTGPSVEIAKNKSAAEKLVVDAEVAFVGFFAAKDNDAMKVFQTVADSNRLIGKFISVVDSASKDEVSVYRKNEGLATTHSVTDKDTLEAFCNEERFPFFGPITGDNYADYFGNGNEIVWFAGGESDYESNGKIIREVAKAFRSEHSFVWLDSDKFKDHAQSSLGVKEFPAVVVQTKEGRYVFPKNKFAVASISSFLKDCSEGKIEKFLMSEAIPETNDEPVKVVVGKSFQDLVLQADKDVLLEVYAPWCGHCKKFEPIYTEFAEKVASNSHLVVAKMDGTTNESPVPNFEWRGFPTIFFVKAGSDTPMPFDGSRTLDGLLEFIKENSSKAVEVSGEESEVDSKDEL